MKFTINIPIEVTIDDDVNLEQAIDSFVASLRNRDSLVTSNFWRFHIRYSLIDIDQIRNTILTAKETGV